MKELQNCIERWFARSSVKKHMAEILAVREELADLNAQFDVRSQIRYYYDSDKEKFAKLCGKIAALKVRLAHLETITRKVETSV